MMFLAVRKVRKTWITITCMLLGVAFMLASLLGYKVYQDAIQTRHEQPNSMQVVKPVLNESLASNAVSDFFVEYRLERDRLRSERSELLRENIKSAQNEDSRQRAQDAILKLVLEKQRESEMENLIKARGYGDALVIIRDNSVNAVIKASTLAREDVVQIADIIGRISGVKAEDIVISAKP